MGAYYSNLGELRTDEVSLLCEKVNFTADEVRALYSRFKKLDRDGTGVINRDSLLKIPELAMNPLVDRIVQCFDEDDEGNITFPSFLACLSLLSPKSTLKEKLSVAFRVYDFNRDGFIDAEEVGKVLRIMVGTNMSEEQTQRLAEQTVASAAQDGRAISGDDFHRLFSTREEEINRIFSVRVETLDG
jgi:Ca2+-binding EF-hand superfamily protein